MCSTESEEIKKQEPNVPSACVPIACVPSVLKYQRPMSSGRRCHVTGTVRSKHSLSPYTSKLLKNLS